jgi:biotin carboxyl carrier protein
MLRRYSVTVAGQARAVEVEELEGGQWRVVVDGRERRLEVRSPSPGTLSWIEGTQVVQATVDGALPRPTVALRGQVIPVEVADARAAAAAAVVPNRPRAAGPATIKAPIPGRVARVLVKVGDAVIAGRGVAVLEAMKMENEIRAPRDGVVKVISCAEGAAVETGQALVTIE